MNYLLRTLLFVCGFFSALNLTANDEWEILEGCRLVDSFLNDGDSFLIEHKGDRFVARMYFVDTAEVSMSYPDRVQDQAEYFGIDAEEALELGKVGTEFAKDFLRGRFTVYTCRQKGGGRGLRYLCLIEKDGQDFGEALVRNGLARVYGYPTPSRPPGGVTASTTRGRLKTHENDAKRDRVGGWGSLKPGRSLEFAPVAKELESDSDTEMTAPVIGIAGKIDVNTASLDQLQEIKGIGPVLSERIQAMRPYEDLSELSKVSGISEQTVVRLSEYLMVIEPEPPAFTAKYYLKNPEQWRNKEVSISIQSLKPRDLPAPDGFSVVEAQTVFEGMDGGSMLIFLPVDRLEGSLGVVNAAPEPIMSSLFFYNYQGTDILIVRR